MIYFLQNPIPFTTSLIISLKKREKKLGILKACYLIHYIIQNHSHSIQPIILTKWNKDHMGKVVHGQVIKDCKWWIEFSNMATHILSTELVIVYSTFLFYVCKCIVRYAIWRMCKICKHLSI